MTVEIWNIKDWFDGYENERDWKVDRSSVFGNPFIVDRHGNRDECIEQYAIYFKAALDDKESPVGWNYHNRMLPFYKHSEWIRLFCWCSPRNCHASIIRARLIFDTKGEFV